MPSGVQVHALVRGYMVNGATVANALVFPAGDGSTSTNPAGNLNFTSSPTVGGAGAFNLRTSTSQQIKAVANAASTTLLLVTYGWIDTRGRFN